MKTALQPSSCAEGRGKGEIAVARHRGSKKEGAHHHRRNKHEDEADNDKGEKSNHAGECQDFVCAVFVAPPPKKGVE